MTLNLPIFRNDIAVSVRYTADVAHNHHNMWCVNSSSISDCDVVTNNGAWFCRIDYGKSGLCIGKGWHNSRTITDFRTNSGEYSIYRLTLYYCMLPCTFLFFSMFRSISINHKIYRTWLCTHTKWEMSKFRECFVSSLCFSFSPKGCSYDVSGIMARVRGFSSDFIDYTFQFSHCIE